MSVSSMTGFARSEQRIGDVAFVWEMRSVNGKGLDVRLRLPATLEAIEPDVRQLVSRRLTRGNVQISCQVQNDMRGSRLVLNEALLEAVLALTDQLVTSGRASPPSADGLLALRGVMDSGAETNLDIAAPELRRAILEGFSAALNELCAARRQEGEALRQILMSRLDEIESVARRAEDDPARRPEVIKERLRRQVALLLEAAPLLDEARIAQEAALLATRADIREELDRLFAHLAAVHALLAYGGAIGRRLDFLSQEFNRESNTICSKSTAASLTALGLELKVLVDQFHEQVQNIE